MTVKATIPTGSINLGINGAPTIAYGTGVPSGTHKTGASSSPTGTPAVGSMYINTSGTSGARVYFYFGGSWVAQTSP